MDRSECIEWAGNRLKAGYGRRKINGKHYLAHRLVWEVVNGEIPPGLCVLHRCDNPPCVNIDHLFLGTLKDNADDMLIKRRGWNQNKTHCPNGHALIEPNLDYYSAARGRRACRVCRNERCLARWRARKR